MAIVDKYGKEAFTFLDNFLRVTIPFCYKPDEYIKPMENSDDTNDGTEHGIGNNSIGKNISDEKKLIKTIKENSSKNDRIDDQIAEQIPLKGRKDHFKKL